MVSYLYSAPNGIPGDITRTDKSNVEPIKLVAVTGVYATFGAPLKYVAGGASQFNGGGEDKTAFAGVLVREVPQQANSSGDDLAFTPTTPDHNLPQGICVRGYVAVKCVAGTPARGGTVYVQIVAHSGAAVGDFRADGTDSGNAIALDAVQAEWATDGVDANGNAELRIAR